MAFFQRCIAGWTGVRWVCIALHDLMLYMSYRVQMYIMYLLAFGWFISIMKVGHILP